MHVLVHMHACSHRCGQAHGRPTAVRTDGGSWPTDGCRALARALAQALTERGARGRAARCNYSAAVDSLSLDELGSGCPQKESNAAPL